MSIFDRFKSGSPPPPAPAADSTPAPTQPAAKTVHDLPASLKTEAAAIGQQAYQSGARQLPEAQPVSNPSTAAAPEDGSGGGNAAYRQKHNNQDKVQSAGSPTDDAAGKTVQSARVDPPQSPAPSSGDSPPASPSPTPSSTPTPAKGRGGWDR